MILACVIFCLAALVPGQTYTPPAPPEPADYGKVIIENYSSNTALGPVVFDHWLHRSKFTCRLCHVDLGFAMQANGTGIAASSIREGRYCGACHNGNRIFEGKTIFAACSANANAKQCVRCHSLGKRGARKYHYSSFTSKLPKARYGIDWDAAETEGRIRLADSLEGIPVEEIPILTGKDFSIKADLHWAHPIVFSHEKHARWNGCDLCHREIFLVAPKTTAGDSMFLHIEGRYCGACHGKVAFPLNTCSRCHPEHAELVR